MRPIAYLVIFCFLDLFFLNSCHQNDSQETPVNQDAKTIPAEAEVASRPPMAISISELALGDCMSLPLLYQRLQDPKFTFPAALMTTGFELLTPDTASDSVKFLAYSSFYLKTAPANELIPFTKPTQVDCKFVQLSTASGVQLKYKILESSDRRLKLELLNEFDETVPNYQKENLFKRYQPTELDISIVSDTELKIEKKMRLFDPLCRKKKNGFELKISESYSWANSEIELPLTYPIEKDFIVLVLTALKEPPWLEPDKSIPVPAIKEIMLAPIRDEIKICN